MRIILSRKGLDSAAGGIPSPLIDGRPVSMPIPTSGPTPTTYGRLGGDVGALISDLTNKRLGPDSPCHLDPDIERELLPRRPGWRGAFGQTGAAQSHLDNQGVGPGDVFVFWGLFRRAERDGDGGWRFVGPSEHRIYGWMQIAEVLRVGSEPDPALAQYPWLADHPHVRPGWSSRSTVYVATESLGLDGDDTGAPGWGVFGRGRRLTGAGKSPSRWNVPDWVNPKRGGTGMSFHKPAAFDEDGTLRAAARGQEFVADVTGRGDALDWLRALIEAEA
jgi:hypothetical protein